MRNFVIVFLFVSFALLFCGIAIAQNEGSSVPWTAREIRLIDKPTEIVAILPNGMTVIVKENHTAPVAAVRMYVRAGSIYEEQHLGAGLSHLFEHLLAGGATKSRTEEQSRKLIEQMGARYNAMTSKAYTCYFLTVPAQHVGSALNLVADWVIRPTFPQEAFDREWKVVQRELEMGATNPDRQLWKLLDELRYTVHPGRYPIIGHQSVVQALSRDDIFAYYEKMYIPDHIVIAVVGDINAGEMLEAIRKEFSDFKRRQRPNIVLPNEPEITSPRQTTFVCPALNGPAKMIVGFGSFDLRHKDLYALDTLAAIMGDGLSSRLYRRLREKEQLVLGISSWNYTPYWAAGTFAVSCELTPENIEQAKVVIWEEIDRVKKEGVTEQELARAKRQQQVNHIRSNQTAEQQASAMARDYLATGDAYFSSRYVENMQKVTAQQVQTMAKKYLVPEKQLTVILTPRPVAPEKTAKAEQVQQFKIKKITLDNGLRVLLKRNPAVPLVNMQLYVMGGLLDETEGNNGITNVMTYLSTKGTKNYSSEQIASYFDDVGGSYAAACGNNTFFYKAEVMPVDFAKTLEIFSEIVLFPTFLDDELKKSKQRILASISQIDNSWWSSSSRFFRQSFFVNSPYQRTQLGEKSSVEAISRQQLVDFHTKNIAGARSVLAIFGDIDIQATELLVRERFGPMPKGSLLDLTRFDSTSFADPTHRFTKKIDKTGAAVFVGYPGMQLRDIEDRYAMDVARQIVGSNTGWLHERLRGQGLVYYAWAINFPGLIPGYFAATAQCEAEKVNDVIAAIKEELSKASQGDFSDEQVSLAKSKLINAEVLEKQTNADAASSAALDELYGFGYDWSELNVDRIMNVTIDDVKRVTQKYISGLPVITIVTSDPKKAMPK